MTEPIVFISRHRVAEGRHDDLARAYAGAVDLIRATKPGTALFAAYVDGARAEVRIVHAFPDAACDGDPFRGLGGTVEGCVRRHDTGRLRGLWTSSEAGDRSNFAGKRR